MESKPHIVVAGAGAIGCFVGGLLHAGGRSVSLLTRPRIGAELRAHGLTLTDYAGMAHRLAADDLTLSNSPQVLETAQIVLVCVKSAATAELASTLAEHAPQDAIIISLQNGTENADALRAALPDHEVRAGMVPFNVVPMGQGGFHRATSGDIVIGTGTAALGETLSVPELTLEERSDITALQWGKFLINLNNALNALSGLPLQQQLRDRGWRKLMADQWGEALNVLRASGITPASTTPLSVGLIPYVLRLPTPIFTRVAASMLTIDATARTSMAHDLMARRPTEIDALQGQVMRMGRAVGQPTPINARVAELIELAELAAEGLPNLPVRAVRSSM